MQKKVAKKDISNNELAQMIARGFASTATKDELRAVEQRIEQRITGVEGKLVTVEQNINHRIDILDSKIDDVQDSVNRLEEDDVLNLQTRVSYLEKTVKKIVTRMPNR